MNRIKELRKKNHLTRIKKALMYLSGVNTWYNALFCFSKLNEIAWKWIKRAILEAIFWKFNRKNG